MALSTIMRISFLFMALTASSFSGIFAIQAVLDVYGSPVRINTPYNIQSVAQPTKFVSRGKQVLDTLCPQAALLSFDPTPVKFLVDTETGSVPLSTDLNVKFDGVDECSESGIWKLNAHKLPIPDVTVSGTLKAADSTFKIEKYNNGYKFNISGYAGDIGVYSDPIHNTDHLALLLDSPLNVAFVPATAA